MAEMRGSQQRDGECRARQGREMTDRVCWARHAPGGKERRTRGVPEEASDATGAPAMLHELVSE